MIVGPPLKYEQEALPSRHCEARSSARQRCCARRWKEALSSVVGARQRCEHDEWEEALQSAVGAR
ncbi:hypothetical protein SESBI_20818 [Sesbania bispinosa]|nr:hypothetical protein SESBI_20818 [Sesbania bispinosa]